ncbi:uncharacterized protein LOC128650439 [Bombina bombina]|uniref:uncharacterized protein LOC128650439 n=1 Tax=Bombina bombina TaxID=8345 RepID=UPI00235B240D|nr:uncharacterized protein LOC128650439 [Bombina bombina]
MSRRSVCVILFSLLCERAISQAQPKQENITGFLDGSVLFNVSQCKVMGELSFLREDKNNNVSTRVFYVDGTYPDHVHKPYKDRVQCRNGSCSLQNLRMEDTGWYRWMCEATPDTYFYLSVAAQPKQENITGFLDGSVFFNVIRCKVMGELSFLREDKNNNVSTRVFYVDGIYPDRVHKPYKDRVQCRNSSCSLQNLRMEDTGWYRWMCEATSDKYFYLSVAGLTRKLSISTHQSHVKGIQGQTLELAISYQITQPITFMQIQWDLLSSPTVTLVMCTIRSINVGTANEPRITQVPPRCYKNRMDITLENGSLIIKGLRKNDTGIYQVTLRDSVRSVVATINVTVEDIGEVQVGTQVPDVCYCATNSSSVGFNTLAWTIMGSRLSSILITLIVLVGIKIIKSKRRKK